jgi:Thymidine kinase
MSSLYFKYGQMNSGKTTALIQAAYNYEERGMTVIVYKPMIDTRETDHPEAVSRIGLKHPVVLVGAKDNLFGNTVRMNDRSKVHCVLVDEAQFLTRDQVDQLTDVVDLLDIPVMCYGLRTDFQGELFPGSHRLLALADKLEEIKTICHCGRKATMVLRIDDDGVVVRDGAQVVIGGNDRYVSVCRAHHVTGVYK